MHLRAEDQWCRPVVAHGSADGPANGPTHYGASHDRAAHDRAAHDRAAHDRAAHNRRFYGLDVDWQQSWLGFGGSPPGAPAASGLERFVRGRLTVGLALR